MAELKLAVYGYGTNAGKAFFEGLAQTNIHCAEIYPLAYGMNEYDAVNLMERNYGIINPDEYDFVSANLFISFADDNDSKKLVREAHEAGCLVIDASGAKNGAKLVYLDGFTNLSLDEILASRYVVPMSSAATMLALVLNPLAKTFGLAHADVTLMESVSCLSVDGAAELARETIALLNMKPVEQRLFDSQMAFNVHTAIGTCGDSGITTHEQEIMHELALALGENLASQLMVNCVLVPVFYGNTAVINITTNRDAELDEVKGLLNDCIFVESNDGDEITPVTHGTNEDNLFISRVRALPSDKRRFSFIVVMDNARRGLSSNALALVKKFASEY